MQKEYLKLEKIEGPLIVLKGGERKKEEQRL